MDFRLIAGHKVRYKDDSEHYSVNFLDAILPLYFLTSSIQKRFLIAQLPGAASGGAAV